MARAVLAPDEEVAGIRLDAAEGVRAFYRATLPSVYGYLLARCGDAAVAEDVTQETFLAVVVEARRGTAVAAPLPWVLGIARHKLLDHLRRQTRDARRRSPREVDESVPDDSLPTLTDDRATDELTRTALASLPTDQRAALLLRHADDLSVMEVAAALGRSVHAAESLLARARANFRRRYLALLPPGEE